VPAEAGALPQGGAAMALRAPAVRPTGFVRSHLAGGAADCQREDFCIAQGRWHATRPPRPRGGAGLGVGDDAPIDGEQQRLPIQWTSPPGIALVGHPLLDRAVVPWITS
jgi:hypothetical protein